MAMKARRRIPPSKYQNLEFQETAHLVPLALPPGVLHGVRVVELVVPPTLLYLLPSPRLHRARATVVLQEVVIDLVNL